MKMFLNPATVRPKGKARDVFDSVMGVDSSKSGKKPKKKNSKKKNKPWKNNNGSKKEEN